MLNLWQYVFTLKFILEMTSFLVAGNNPC